MRISLERFIKLTEGQTIDVSFPHTSNLKGQCVSLIQEYLRLCLGQPDKARGHARDWATTYVNEGLGTIVSEARNGDLLVFPKECNRFGHIGIYYNGKIYDQNNTRHDQGKAGLGEIFSNDYIIIRPNVELVKDVEYLNLSNLADTWRVYKMDVAPVVGNECKQLLPSKFGGLSYTIKRYINDNVAVIETRDFGEVQIYIGKDVSNMFSITNEPVYGLVK